MSKNTPFNKILIANRGEIALRVMRTAHRLGYQSVAVYSTADANARHVREADQAVCIGAALPAQSYLRIAAIIDAAQRSGAQAVHPGYGFLSEKDEFARACRDAGLVFIGPSPEAILAMGHKAGAKDLMMKAGVPCIPGFQSENTQDQAEDVLQREAKSVGYPLMIKAVAGGGGRGMRLVLKPEEFISALRSAKSEASGAFGDDTVLLERAILDPRHIEIQIFADRHGHAIHLGERDCSVQRRHQKLVEEAPSPAVSPELRAQMGATAVKAALAIGYEGAGTLEFLLDAQGNYFFMEMNTRLQVEHTVTEAITGLDLVELQLRVASGEPLGITQDQVQISGHAIEVRLCAEDADAGFMPQSGHMRLWQMPDEIRVDHALESGMDVPPYYDSMIAKLIAHGRTRDDALRQLAAALDRSVTLGVTTNRAFLARCLRHPVFAQGSATTGFIAAHSTDLLARDAEQDRLALAIAALLMQATRATAQTPGRLCLRHPASLRIELLEKTSAVLLQSGAAGNCTASIAGADIKLRLLGLEAGLASIDVEGIGESVVWSSTNDVLDFQFRGIGYRAQDRSLTAESSAVAGSDGKVRASMNGRIVAVHANVGDRLERGQAIFTLEAMKMEHTHTAPIAGVLKLLNAGLDDQVSAARIIAEIEVEMPAVSNLEKTS